MFPAMIIVPLMQARSVDLCVEFGRIIIYCLSSILHLLLINLLFR